MDKAIERAIAYIWERYSEPLSLTDIARSAMLSRFYFARTFRNVTGVTPGRYLAAVRIYQAKRMLLSTSTSITDITYAVGYNSLGSFTTYFTKSVGVSPSQFRRISRDEEAGLPLPIREPAAAHGTVAGTLNLPHSYADCRVYLGTFTTAIVQYQPSAATIVDMSSRRPTAYLLHDVPAGTWMLHAVAVADTADDEPWARRTLMVSEPVQVTVTSGAVTQAVVRLRPRLPTDPPILFALPDLQPSAKQHAASVDSRPAGVMNDPHGPVIR
jgi:AraC family transcriptional regulator